jgi:hypothetical protein
VSVGWDDEVNHDDAALEAVERDRLALRVKHYRRLLSKAKEFAAQEGKGLTCALMTPIGFYTVKVDAAGDPLGRIQFEPSDGKIKGYSAGTMIIDDQDGPAGRMDPATGIVRGGAQHPGLTRRAKIFAGRHRWECPCGASHDRGCVDGVSAHRCLKCGYVGEGGKIWDPEEVGPWRAPIYLDVKAAAAAAAEHYNRAPVTPTLSIGNKPATIDIPDNTPGWVGTKDSPAYFLRQARTANWLCCVRKSDGAVIEVDSGVPSAGPVPKMKINTVSQGDADDAVARSFFYIDHNLVASIMHEGEPAIDDVAAHASTDWPPIRRDYAAEARAAEETARYRTEQAAIMNAFRLPPVHLLPARGGYSIEGSLSPVGALRAELKEAGAKMLRTCGTCKGTGGDDGGSTCRACRGSGSVAS